MSLKSRLQKNREAKSFGSGSSGCPDFDLILYLKKHPEITSLTAYSHDNIFAEKNGVSRKIIKSFASKEKYFEQIKKLSALSNSNSSEKNLHFTVNLPQGYFAEVFLPPLVQHEPIVIVSNSSIVKNNDFDKIISDEMLEYLKKCVDKKINIFVVAPSNIDKSSVLNVLSQTADKNKSILLCDDKQTLVSQNPCNIRFTKALIKNEIKISADNIFCSEADTDDLLKIFKMILSGQNGFVVSLSANTNSDLLMTMRNLILLSNMNLFEENADFMVTSAMQVVVLLESTKNGGYRVSKISEMSQNEDDESELSDIFVWDNVESHISTGIQSRFLTDKFVLSKTLFSESKKHGYTQAQEVFENIKDISQNEIANDFSTYSEVEETPMEIVEQAPQKSKLEKLKEKIKKNKAEFADLTDKVEKTEKNDSADIAQNIENTEKTVIKQAKIDDALLQKNEITEKSDLPQKETAIKNILADSAEETENNAELQTTTDLPKREVPQNDFQKELDLLTNSANKEEIESIFGKDALADKKSEKTSLTEAVAESKNDKIYNILQAEEDKIEISEKPIKNILADEDDEISVSESLETEENAESATDVSQEVRDKAFFEGKSAEIVEEPELFDEISGIDVDEYSDEDEIIELPDDI